MKVAVRALLCSGMPIVSLLSRGSWIGHNLPCDDLLAGGGLIFGDALPVGDAPLSDDGDKSVLGNVLVPLRDQLSGASVCTCRIV